MVGKSCVLPPFRGTGAVTYSNEDRMRAQLDQALLLADAEQAALGWGYLTVDGFGIKSEPDLERYLQALEAFDAGGRRAGVQVSGDLFPPDFRHSRRSSRGKPPGVRMRASGSRNCMPA
jgi:hypothetical protein